MNTNLRYFPLTHFKDDEKLKTKKLQPLKWLRNVNQLFQLIVKSYVYITNHKICSQAQLWNCDENRNKHKMPNYQVKNNLASLGWAELP